MNWGKIFDPLGLINTGGGAQFQQTPNPQFKHDQDLVPFLPGFDPFGTVADSLIKNPDGSFGVKRRGRASTVLTGSQGAGLPNTATASLLGD